MLTKDEFAYAAGRHDVSGSEESLDEIFSYIDGPEFLEFLRDEIDLCMVAGVQQGDPDPVRTVQVLALGFFAKGWIAHKALTETNQ